MNEIAQTHSGSGDNIAGNKILNIIRDQKVTNVQIENADKLRPEDEKEFGDDVARNRIKEYRNLLNRIDFHADLGEFDTANNFVQEANLICHNHHIILSYNALCIYALSDVKKLTTDNSITDKILKLLNKAKELNNLSKYHMNISATIAKNFYNLLKDSIFYLRDNAPKNWRRISLERQQLYYEAIVRHLFKLETCFEIHQNTDYLKTFINHLCGHEGYPWINLTESGEIDFGSIFLGEPTTAKLKKLEKRIRDFEPSYQMPEILYGNYFDTPLSKKDFFSIKERQKYFGILVSLLGVIAFLTPLLMGYEIWGYLNFLVLYFLVALIFQPFGDYRMNLIERISRIIHKKIIHRNRS
jgi:hypothetical protein